MTTPQPAQQPSQQQQPPPAQQQSAPMAGIVKQVLSGDTVVIRGMVGSPPSERTLILTNITAPKLAKWQTQAVPDEPYAWEAREYLRKKLVGKKVEFTLSANQPSQANSSDPNRREYGTIFLVTGSKKENVTESLVSEGLVTVRNENVRSPSPELQRLIQLQEEAKSAHKGKWNETTDSSAHVRTIKWTVPGNSLMNFVDQCEGKPIKAIIEHVRDGSTVRAFLMPNTKEFVYVTLMMTGIKCPANKLDSDGKPDLTTKVEFADEAKFFTESRILQQEVEVILESVNNNNFVGTIRHPKGDIAEILLSNGLAKCVDYSLHKMKKADVERYRAAEKKAKESRLRLWKNWTPPPKINDKVFHATVVEVVNGDALNVKKDDGSVKKIFLAGIRPPRDQNAGGGGGEEKPAEPAPRTRTKRPLYDVPWMFEAREFLRKRLIGKKVKVTVDYIQPARDNLPEKVCCTVHSNSVNLAETMVSKGLATVVRYRQNDEQRPSEYDALLAAELKAQKSNKGVHSKKDTPVLRVNDISGDSNKAKSFLANLKKSRVEALVEYVTNGSRLRLYIPKSSLLITFLLSGIEVRYSSGDPVNNEEAATNFTREYCMQKDVEIEVESTDKNGNFIGWLFVDNVNLSVALVEAGLAKIHFSGENSKYSKDLNNAKNLAKSRGLWKYVEKEETTEVIEEDKTPDRRVDQKEVLVVETNELTFYCQEEAHAAKLDAQQAKISEEMAANPPLPGAYTPKKGDLCAAKYPVDDMWYRAKVERVGNDGKVTVFYVDYGNRGEVTTTQCAALPSAVSSDRPFAQLYTLAFVGMPPDAEDQKAAAQEFRGLVQYRKLLLNFEYTDKVLNYATLYDRENKEDIGKSLVADGFLLRVRRRERRFEKLMADYEEAENTAKSKRLNMWMYGDVREDDDKEFGMGR